jgi:hypothetical protein
MHGIRFARAAAAAGVAYAAGLSTQALRGQADWLFGLNLRQAIIAAFVSTLASYTISNLGARFAGWILLHRPAIDAKMGARANDPLAAILSDRRSGVAILAVSSITLAGGICFYDFLFLPAAAMWNLCLAPVGAFFSAFIWNEWVNFKVAHLWLVARGCLPRQLSGFLRECHSGGILRKNGNHFEFRHQRLQESLRSVSGEEPGRRPWSRRSKAGVA